MPQPQSADTGPTGTFVGGKINQFRGDLTSIQTQCPHTIMIFLDLKI